MKNKTIKKVGGKKNTRGFIIQSWRRKDHSRRCPKVLCQKVPIASNARDLKVLQKGRAHTRACVHGCVTMCIDAAGPPRTHARTSTDTLYQHMSRICI